MTQDRIYSYFENNAQLHVLFIFDQSDIVRSELEGKEWKEDYVYKIFDGAWFNAKYNIENTWKDNHVVLLFDTKYPRPVTEEQQLHFPLMDMLRANKIFEKESYASFMQQYDLPEKFRGFVSKHIEELTATKMKTMIGAYYTKNDFSKDVVCRGLLSSYLGEKKLLDWQNIVVKMIILGSQGEEKKRTTFFGRLEKNHDAKEAVDNQLTKVFGRTYKPNTAEKTKEIAQCLKYNSMTQLLDELAGDNYKQLKATSQLMIDEQNKIYETGTHDYAEKFSVAMDELASDIREDEIIKVYGVDAQYFFMTDKLCWPILKNLLETSLVASPMSIIERTRELSLKLPTDSTVQIAIRFVEQVALYYDKVRTIDTLKLNSPQAYVDRYVSDFYLLDMFYRHSLEEYHKLVEKDFPILQTTSDIKRQLDQDYAKIMNVLNLEWMDCVKERGNYFDDIKLPRQQDFYKNERDANVKQVVIISDALRYEVAAELMQELAKEKHIAELSACMAMLPTETKYCKNALLPHETLTLAGNDNIQMMVDGKKGETTNDREKILSDYQNGAICIGYSDVMNGDQDGNRELFKHPLVYIYHDTIDEHGHSGNPFDVTKSCRDAINQLKVLIKRIHATWNVTSVILTSDHGFIYNDMTFDDKDKHQIKEESLESKTRYYLTRSEQKIEGVVKLPLNKVSGITTKEPIYVAVPEGTNRFAMPGGYNFDHGGSALQEIVIPIIRSSQRRTDKTEKVGVTLMNHNLNVVSSRLKFQLIQSEAVSMTVKERKITCCIYNGDARVSNEQELTLNSADATNINNRVFDVTLILNKDTKSTMLQLKIYDVEDSLNPLVTETVKNNTLIDRDF